METMFSVHVRAWENLISGDPAQSGVGSRLVSSAFINSLLEWSLKVR